MQMRRAFGLSVGGAAAVLSVIAWSYSVPTATPAQVSQSLVGEPKGGPSTVLPQPQARLVGTFSSFRLHEESGDLLGIEIKIVPTSTGTVAIVQVAAGEPGQPAISAVSTSMDSLFIVFQYDAQREATFRARVSGAGLGGTLVIAGGAPRPDNLPRRCGYWDA